MSSDTRVDLFLEWQEALNSSEIDAARVASLESTAQAMGLDLWKINTIMLNSSVTAGGVTAATWNPDLHPRGRDGRFIDVLGFVRLFDFVDRKGSRHSESSGRVKSIKPDQRNPGNPDIEVTLDDGSNVVVKPSQVATAPRSKARLRLGTEEGDRSPGAEARRNIEQMFAEDPPLSSRQVQEFEGRFDPLAQFEKKKARIDAALDADRTPSDQELVEWSRELQDAKNALQPRDVLEEVDLEPAFEEGVPDSIRDAYIAYQEAERGQGKGSADLLTLDDWVEAGSPKGGAPESDLRERIQSDLDGTEPINQDTILRDIDELDQADARQLLQEMIDANEGHDRLDVLEDALFAIAPAPPAEAIRYDTDRDIGNLMVGDEVILPGDIPGRVEGFEFPGDAPDSVIVRTDNGIYQGKTGDVLPSHRETNPIGMPVDVDPGEEGSKTNPIRTSDPLEAVKALQDGKYVELESVDQVATLLNELADIAQEAKAAGAQAENYDLCLVSVPDTNLFCAEAKGIPRIQMPQLGGIPIPGSKADELPKNDGGEVDIGPAFIEYLRAKGVTVEEKRRKASHLKASQSELVGAKVAGMMKWMESGDDNANRTIRESAIFTTTDGYVVDGHHRWASVVGLDAQEGDIDDLDMPVREIDMDIMDVLQEANDFAISMGVPPQAAGAVPSGAPPAPAGATV
jgi:hypothetical protein